MKRLVSTVPLVVAALLLVPGASPAGQPKPKLSEVAEKAKSPPAEDATPPRGLSQEKTKQPVVTVPPPTSPPHPPSGIHPHGPTGDWIDWRPSPGYVLVRVDPGYGVADESREEPAGSPVRGRLGLVGGGGGVATDAMDGYGSGGLLVGMERAGWSVDLRGWRSSASFGRDLSEAFRDLHAWSADVVLGAPLTGGGAGPALRFLAGARAGRLDWHFRNTVTIPGPPAPRAVSRDTLGFAALFAGLELEIFREAEWALGTTVAVGRQRFGNDTGEGFENDLFRDSALVEGVLQVIFFPSRGSAR